MEWNRIETKWREMTRRLANTVPPAPSDTAGGVPAAPADLPAASPADPPPVAKRTVAVPA